MSDKQYSRRTILQKSLQLCSALLGLGFLSGCGQGDSAEQAEEEAKHVSPVDSCDDLSGVSPSEVDKREVYGYVEESPYPDNVCSNCNLYIPPAEGSECGGCVLFEGPVFASGYCDYWEPVA